MNQERIPSKAGQVPEGASLGKDLGLQQEAKLGRNHPSHTHPTKFQTCSDWGYICSGTSILKSWQKMELHSLGLG